ncbi:MAG: TIGR02452 family protein [Alphaproteobacteria bacterium 40-19]|nr:MAG: TIGR02452 family protein [Alphaproteobacteria bacterium 40-19]
MKFFKFFIAVLLMISSDPIEARRKSGGTKNTPKHAKKKSVFKKNKNRNKRHRRSGKNQSYQPTQRVQKKFGSEIMSLFNVKWPDIARSAAVGRHGDQLRVDTFKDTLQQVAARYPYKGTAENYTYTTPLQPLAKAPIAIEVLEVDTLKAAQDLVNQGLKPLVLDMANAFRPGGAPEAGARAQEEELCRRSNLYPSLLALSEGNTRFIAEKGAVYIPGVTVFKKGAGDHYAEMVPFSIDVLASAAPDLRHKNR